MLWPWEWRSRAPRGSARSHGSAVRSRANGKFLVIIEVVLGIIGTDDS
jgi:hypothetical protein